MESDAALTVDVRDAGIVVEGELDKQTAPQLFEALELFVGRTVRVDMAAVTFFDSTGIGTLTRAKSRGIDVVLVDPSHAVRRVLEIVGLLAYFGVD